MATYLPREVYTSFRGHEDIAQISSQFHAGLDATVADNVPTSSDSLTNPTLATPQPTPESPPDLAAAVPQPAAPPPLPAPVEQTTVPPPGSSAPAAASPPPAPTSPSFLDDLGSKFHQGLDASLRSGGQAVQALTELPATVAKAVTSSTVGTDVFQKALAWGMAQQGKPYIWGSAGGRSDLSGNAAGYDCSGFVSQFYHQMGIDLPAQTASAYAATTHLDAKDAVPGDIVEFNMSSSDPHMQHIAIYLGDGKILQSGGGQVKAVNIGDIKGPGGEDYQFRRAVGAPDAATNAAATAHVSTVLDAGPPKSSGGLSPFDDIFKKHAGDLANDPTFLRIVTAGAKAESNLDPSSVQKGGGGRGLFQFDVNGGMGQGLSQAQLNDPEFQASRIIPLYAAAYRNAPANLKGADLAAWVAVQAERPDDRGGVASTRYRDAYNSLGANSFTGGGGTAYNTRDTTPASSSNPLDVLGQAKDAVGSSLSDIAARFHQGLDDTLKNAGAPGPMTAAQQPTPSDSLTRPAMQANPTTPAAGTLAAPAPQPTVFDQAGQAIAENQANTMQNPIGQAWRDSGAAAWKTENFPSVVDPKKADEDALTTVMAIMGGGDVKAASEVGDVLSKASPAVVQTALSKAQEAVDALKTRFPQMSPGSLAASGPGKVLAAAEAAAKDLHEATPARTAPVSRAAPLPADAATVPAPAGAIPPIAKPGDIGFSNLLSGTGVGDAMLTADLKGATARMDGLRTKFPQMTDEQAAATPLGKQIASLQTKLDARTPAAVRSPAETPAAPAAAVPEYQRIAQEAVDKVRGGAAARAEAAAKAAEAPPGITFDAQGNQVSGADRPIQTAPSPAPAPDWLETAVAEQRAAKAAGEPIARETDLGPAIGRFSDLQEASAKAPPSLGDIAWGVMAEGKKSIFSLSNVHAMNIARGLTTSPAGPGGAAEFAKAYVNAIVRGVQEHPQVTAAVEAATKDGVQFFAHSPETGGAVSGINPLIVKGAQAALGGVSSASSVYGASKAAGASDEDALRNAVIAGGIGAIAGPTLAIRMHDALWKDAVPLAKVLSWSAAKEAGLSGPEAAKFANNLNGGQNLAQVAGSKPMHDLLRLVVQSPDWLLSQLKLTGAAAIGAGKTVMDPGSLKSLVGGQMTSTAMTGSQQVSRDWLIKQLVVYGFATEALQYGLTGHFTDQNSPGRQFMVEMPTGSSSKSGKSENMTTSLFDGNLQQVLDAVAKHDPGSTIAGKFNPWLSTPMELLTNKQYLGGSAPPITAPGDTGLAEKWKQAQFVASKFAPIGISSPVQEAYAGAPLPAIVGSTLTGLPMSHNTGAPGQSSGGSGGGSSRSAVRAPARAPVRPAIRAPARAAPLPARR